jgi:hypothetical protein
MSTTVGQSADLVPHDGQLSPVLPKRIPQDIIDAIIDQLRPYVRGYTTANIEELRQCALVARSWTRRAQLLLFTDIALRSAQACANFHAAICDNPALALYVRRLDLNAPQAWFNNSEHVLPVLAACQELRYLVIKCLRFDELAQFVTRALEGKFAARTLMITACAFPTPATLQAFVLSVARNVDTLILRGVQVKLPDDSLDEPLQPLQRIHLPKLWIYHPQLYGLGIRVGETLGKTFSGIDSLITAVCNPDDLRQLNALLEELGHAIYDLHIDAVAWQGDDEYGAPDSSSLTEENILIVAAF